MRTRNILALAALCLASAGVASSASGQKTATVVAKIDPAGGTPTIAWGGCSVTLADTVPKNVQTNVVRLRIVSAAEDQVTNAPHPLTMRVGGRDSVHVAADTSGASLRLTEAPLHESTITLSRQGERAVLCVVDVPKDEEEEGAEIDPAFELLAGVELLSADEFRTQSPHIPAAAQWVIPVRVHPLRTDTVRSGTDTVRGRPISRGNVYSILTTAAEHTRLLVDRSYFTCLPTRVAVPDLPSISPGAGCPDAQVGTDSATVFPSVQDSASWDTHGTWRVQSKLRWEWNLPVADRDVFLGPVVMLGVQTDPGLGFPDFTGLFTWGLSLTQVQITNDYWDERFNLQVAWGNFPSFAESVYSLANSPVNRIYEPQALRRRAHIMTSFQPATGYFIRGSVEFGKGVPDLARIGVVTKLDVRGLLGSIVGKKEPRQR